MKEGVMKCTVCNNCKYVSKKEAKTHRREFMKFLSTLSSKMKEDGYGGFVYTIVGSAKRNMIVQRGKSLYDTDIQIMYYGKRGNALKTTFKKTFYNELKNVVSDNYKLHQSSSVITINMLKDGKEYHSFDLAIIRTSEYSEMNRGKEENESSKFNFSWGKIRNTPEAYKIMNKIKGSKRRSTINSIKQSYINKKCENWDKNKDDSSYKTSSQLFVDAVNENTK